MTFDYAADLSCCTYTRVASCMESCQFALTSTMSVDDIVDHMSADCGMPDLRVSVHVNINSANKMFDLH